MSQKEKTFVVTFKRTVVTQMELTAKSAKELRERIEADGVHETALDAGIMGYDETKIVKIEPAR